MQQYNCYSLRLAGFLMQKGFVPLEMRKDFKSKRNVFIFNKSQELEKEIKNYQKV